MFWTWLATTSELSEVASVLYWNLWFSGMLSAPVRVKWPWGEGRVSWLSGIAVKLHDMNLICDTHRVGGKS